MAEQDNSNDTFTDVYNFCKLSFQNALRDKLIKMLGMRAVLWGGPQEGSA